jgi:hypothetical protein
VPDSGLGQRGRAPWLAPLDLKGPRRLERAAQTERPSLAAAEARLGARDKPKESRPTNCNLPLVHGGGYVHNPGEAGTAEATLIAYGTSR